MQNKFSSFVIFLSTYCFSLKIKPFLTLCYSFERNYYLTGNEEIISQKDRTSLCEGIPEAGKYVLTILVTKQKSKIRRIPYVALKKYENVSSMELNFEEVALLS